MAKIKSYLTKLWPGLEELKLGITGVKDVLQASWEKTNIFAMGSYHS